MSADDSPRHDLPFPADVVRYCAARLTALGFPTDREWLKGEPDIVEVLCGADQRKMAAEARKSLPQTHAVWETSDFYRCAIPLAIFDVTTGPMGRFEYFELLYLRILGEEGRPWLPSLYLAAITAPHLLPDFRIKYFNRFDADRLDVEQEIADREALRDE